MTVPSTARLIRDIKTPEGFEREVRTEPKTNWCPSYKVLTLRSSDIEITIEFFGGPNRRESYFLANGHVSFDSSAGRRSFDRYGVEDSFYIDNPVKWDNGRLWEGDRVVLGKNLGTVKSSAGYKGWGDDRHWVDEIIIAWDSGEEETFSERQFKRRGIKKADVIEQTNQKIKTFIEVKIPEARERLDHSENVPGIPFMVTAERKAEVISRIQSGQAYTFMPSGFGTGYTLSGHQDAYSKRADKETERFFGVSPIYVNTFDAD